MESLAKVIDLHCGRCGAARGACDCLCRRDGRFEVATVGFDPNLQLVGGDPWGSPDSTGLVVPTAPTATLGTPSFRFRYLFLLARAQFGGGERVRLVGVRQYASLRGNLGTPSSVSVAQGCSDFEFPIESPLWRFCDANISWHVMIRSKGTLAPTRNVLNSASLMFRDSFGSALLYQTLAPYSPPNAGRPYGQSLRSDLGNIHDLRYPWRDSEVEEELDIPLPPNADISLVASVAQHDPVITLTLTAAEALAVTPEDRFWAAFQNVQYHRVAGGLIFRQEDWAK